MKKFSEREEVNRIFDLGFKNSLAFQDMCKTDELSGFYTGILDKDNPRLKIQNIIGPHHDFELVKELAEVRNIFTPGMSLDNHKEMFFDMVIDEIRNKGNNSIIINALHLDCLGSTFNNDRWLKMKNYFGQTSDSMFIGVLDGNINIHYDSSINSIAYPVMCSFKYDGQNALNLNVCRNMDCVSNPYAFIAGPPIA